MEKVGSYGFNPSPEFFQSLDFQLSAAFGVATFTYLFLYFHFFFFKGLLFFHLFFSVSLSFSLSFFFEVTLEAPVGLDAGGGETPRWQIKDR